MANFATVTPSPPSLGPPSSNEADLRVCPQDCPYFLTQLAGAFAVDDPDEWQSGHVGLFQVAVEHIQRIFGALAAQVKFHSGGSSQQ